MNSWCICILSRSGMTHSGASVACAHLGYSYGTVIATPCSQFGGENAWGTAGSTVATKGATCKGDEAAIQECPWNEPAAECRSHLSDSSPLLLGSNRSLRSKSAEKRRTVAVP